MSLRVFVFTCDQYLWALRPFMHLFNQYWSPDVEVIAFGNEPPPWVMPANFKFVSLGKPYGAPNWSNEVYAGLDKVSDEYFVWMLEDYWLNRGVDLAAAALVETYLRQHQDVARFDLTADRQFNGRARDIGTWGHLDLVETTNESDYQISLQAGVWNVTRLRQCLPWNFSPWDFEMLQEGDLPRGLRVVGTKQRPVSYTNGIGSGHGACYVEGIPEKDIIFMREKGWINA